MPRITPDEHPVLKTLETIQFKSLPMNQSVVQFIESYGKTPFAYRDIIHPNNPSRMVQLENHELRKAFVHALVVMSSAGNMISNNFSTRDFPQQTLLQDCHDDALLVLDKKQEDFENFLQTNRQEGAGNVIQNLQNCIL